MIASKSQRKIKRFGALVAAGSVLAACLLAPMPAFAQGPSSTADIADQKITGNDCKQPYANLNKDNCNIIKYVVVLTNILSALVGVTIVASIVWAGIQYSTAKGDPQTVSAAKQRITNAILALVLYIFMVAFLQWVVPGGVF